MLYKICRLGDEITQPRVECFAVSPHTAYNQHGKEYYENIVSKGLHPVTKVTRKSKISRFYDALLQSFCV